MIPRKYRLQLDPRKTFQGHKYFFPWGLIVVASSPLPCWSVSVSKKAAPLAVDRNRFRRQITQHFYANYQSLKPDQAFHLIITKPAVTSDVINQACSLLYIKH